MLRLSGLHNKGPINFENNFIPSNDISRLQIIKKGKSVGNIELNHSLHPKITLEVDNFIL